MIPSESPTTRTLLELHQQKQVTLALNPISPKVDGSERDRISKLFEDVRRQARFNAELKIAARDSLLTTKDSKNIFWVFFFFAWG